MVGTLRYEYQGVMNNFQPEHLFMVLFNVISHRFSVRYCKFVSSSLNLTPCYTMFKVFRKCRYELSQNIFPLKYLRITFLILQLEKRVKNLITKYTKYQ